MTEMVIKAAYASVVEDDGQLFIGFAEGEDEGEPYLLFRQSLAGGPIWTEVTDETFGAMDAVKTLAISPTGIQLEILPAKVAAFGYLDRVKVLLGPDCDGGAEAIAALKAIYPQAT